MSLKNRLKIAKFLTNETKKMMPLGSINKPTDLLDPKSYKEKLTHFTRLIEGIMEREFSTHPLIKLFETYTKTATIAQFYKIGNCGQQARLAFKLAFMMRAGPVSMFIATQGMGHEMLIIGKTKTEEDKASAVIVDPYYDEFYPFNDYLKSQAYKDSKLEPNLYTQYPVFFPERDELFAFFIPALTPGDRAELPKYQKIKQDILSQSEDVQPKINPLGYIEQIKESHSVLALLGIIQELAQNLLLELKAQNKNTIRLYLDMIPTLFPLCQPSKQAIDDCPVLEDIYTGCGLYLKSALQSFRTDAISVSVSHTVAACELLDEYCVKKREYLLSLNKAEEANLNPQRSKLYRP